MLHEKQYTPDLKQSDQRLGNAGVGGIGASGTLNNNGVSANFNNNG